MNVTFVRLNHHQFFGTGHTFTALATNVFLFPRMYNDVERQLLLTLKGFETNLKKCNKNRMSFLWNGLRPALAPNLRCKYADDRECATVCGV